MNPLLLIALAAAGYLVYKNRQTPTAPGHANPDGTAITNNTGATSNPPIVVANPVPGAIVPSGDLPWMLDIPPGYSPMAVDYAPGYTGPATVYVPNSPAAVSPVSAPRGRWKDQGSRGCLFDPNDDGPDQCNQGVPHPNADISGGNEPGGYTGQGYPVELPPVVVGGGGTYDTRGEAGRIRVEGEYFRDESGAVWSYKGVTLFMLMARWMRGEDISGQIAWMKSIGANVARVFGRVPASSVGGWSSWRDYEHPESRADFPQKLSAFFSMLGDNGVRVEYVPLTWAASTADMRRWVQQAFDIAADHWNVFIEVANEPEVNRIDTVEVMKGVNTRGVTYALGNYENAADGSLPRGNYVTAHTGRDGEWPRRVHDALEYKEGGGPWHPNDVACRCPIVLDEPIGAAENNDPGRRSNNPSDFMAYFGAARLMAAGATFHSQCGLEGRAPASNEPNTAACANAVGLAWGAIPPDAQTGAYQRCGGGAFPTACNVSESLRSYASMMGGGVWFIVRVRPTSGLAIIQTSGGVTLAGGDAPVAPSSGGSAPQQQGRYKLDGNGGCYFDANDSGPDQCRP